MTESTTDESTTEITTPTIKFCGADFHVADRIGLMPMMKFAVLAKSGVESHELEGLAAMHDLLKNCIHDDEWDRFEQHATDHRIDEDGLLEAVGNVMSALSDRPTGRSSVSSDGPQVIEPSSTDDSSSPDTGPAKVIAMFNDQGRPDLALLVRRRQESLTG